jgi:hypothetical protein
MEGKKRFFGVSNIDLFSSFQLNIYIYIYFLYPYASKRYVVGATIQHLFKLKLKTNGIQKLIFKKKEKKKKTFFCSVQH